VYFALLSSKKNLGRLTCEFITGESRLPAMTTQGSRDSSAVNTLGSQLPGGEYPGESIMNTSNSLTIKKKFEILSRHVYWDKEKLLDGKKQSKKSCDTDCPFKLGHLPFPHSITDYRSLSCTVNKVKIMRNFVTPKVAEFRKIPYSIRNSEKTLCLAIR
jgi:hypothetical protein